jgi:hypothetical protein
MGDRAPARPSCRRVQARPKQAVTLAGPRIRLQPRCVSARTRRSYGSSPCGSRQGHRRRGRSHASRVGGPWAVRLQSGSSRAARRTCLKPPPALAPPGLSASSGRPRHPSIYAGSRWVSCCQLRSICSASCSAAHTPSGGGLHAPPHTTLQRVWRGRDAVGSQADRGSAVQSETQGQVRFLDVKDFSYRWDRNQLLRGTRRGGPETTAPRSSSKSPY